MQYIKVNWVVQEHEIPSRELSLSLPAATCGVLIIVDSRITC